MDHSTTLWPNVDPFIICCFPESNPIPVTYLSTYTPLIVPFKLVTNHLVLSLTSCTCLFHILSFRRL